LSLLRVRARLSVCYFNARQHNRGQHNLFCFVLLSARRCQFSCPRPHPALEARKSPLHFSKPFRYIRKVMSEISYVIEHAKTARAGCKECKQRINKDDLRIGKVTASPFGSDDDKMTVFYHANCFFKR
jgi:hypothetical protein